MNFKNQQIILVTGKGGVGKSTVAAAIAKKEADSGRKTLLVELGEESFYKPFFGLDKIDYDPQMISPNLYVSIWDVEHCLREYVLHYLKVESIYKIFFQNRIMRTFINAAPAVSELAMLGKVTSNYRHHGPPLPFDVVVVDGYATGHFLALLRAPKGLSEAVNTGPFGEQSASIMKAILNPEVTAFVLVTLPENLPVIEAKELWEALKNEFGVTANLICNKVLELPFSRERLKELVKIAEEEVPPAVSFTKYLEYILERQAKALTELRSLPVPTQQLKQSLEFRKGAELASELSEQL